MSSKFPKTIDGIDKFNKIVQKNITGTTQVGTDVRVVAVRETFMGANITWSFMSDAAATGKEFLLVLLVVIRHNLAEASLSLADGNDGYLPEQDVLWSRLYWGNDAVFTTQLGVDRVKTKRKLKAGDKIKVIMKASGAAVDIRFAAFISSFWGT